MESQTNKCMQTAAAASRINSSTAMTTQTTDYREARSCIVPFLCIKLANTVGKAAHSRSSCA